VGVVGEVVVGREVLLLAELAEPGGVEGVGGGLAPAWGVPVEGVCVVPGPIGAQDTPGLDPSLFAIVFFLN
jgi:hypothetical protein